MYFMLQNMKKPISFDINMYDPATLVTDFLVEPPLNKFNSQQHDLYGVLRPEHLQRFDP